MGGCFAGLGHAVVQRLNKLERHRRPHRPVQILPLTEEEKGIIAYDIILRKLPSTDLWHKMLTGYDRIFIHSHQRYSHLHINHTYT